MITYSEYELLCQAIDQFILGRKHILTRPKDDLIASISFMLPNISDSEVEESAEIFFKDSPDLVKKLEAIKPKLLKLIINQLCFQNAISFHSKNS